MPLNTEKLSLLHRAMDAYQQRAEALTSNVANLDTPGYQRLSVSFEEQLREARHNEPGAQDMKDVEPQTQVEDGPPVLEDELMNLSDNQMRNQLASRALTDHFTLMRMGITGRSTG